MEPKTEQYEGDILVINHVPSLSDYIAIRLKGMGHRCTFVVSVNEANDLMEREDFGAITDCQEFYLCG